MNVIKNSVQKLAHAAGYALISKQLVDSDHIIDSDEQFIQIYEKAAPHTMTSKLRCYALYKAVKFIAGKKLPGALIECGVWKGGNGIIMCETLKLYGDFTRDIYLYDTYEGMVEPGDYDNRLKTGKNAGEEWRKNEADDHNNWCYSSLEEVKSIVGSTNYPPDKVHYIKGKVEDTLKETIPESIAILRLDTDWYESTKIELEILFPLLVSGGQLIIDDYGSWEGAKKAVDEYFANQPILLNRIDTGGRIAQKL